MPQTRPAAASLPAAIGYFAATSAMLTAGVYVGIPFVMSRGGSFLTGYLLCFQVTPFALILALALAVYRREGGEWSWAALSERLRLQRPTIGVLIWGLGLLVVCLGAYLALQPVTQWIAGTAGLAPPAWFAGGIHPLKPMPPGTFMDTQLVGRWWLIPAYLLGWACNIAGEELLFRGYLLPRQEATLGRAAWVVHGLMWWLWHGFWWWQLVALAPITFGLPFVAQKTRSTWPGIIAHGTMNFLAVVTIIAGVVG